LATLSAEVCMGLVRTAQECLTNTLRHARASRVVVTLALGEGAVDVRVEDDGVGALAIEPGAGLRGVRERIALLGGEVTIRSRPGEGTQVEARVPLHHDRRG
jgi:two-component system sensor histidine kinase UhpB